ncbi:NAD(P)-dependent alcohol dehydrogenase [Levilactobacillus zymae]|uniref:NAD(P)-dependent alcohol dehydrogenase n=1 Tax=Levilactobacillus zymae TaxID=267363 RepID=UPI0028B3CF31|nr:NAD(P)-dependent alcohol dehydrogenase [Levilactobacillus zymae]MDT6981390.1 NAD(P)-dependent alcohol dehydrogenase [Levilactobacillus zymae]
MKIKTAVATEQGAPLQIIDAELDDPKANEVLVKIVASGICHTDAEGQQAGLSPYPVALGHEGSGIVERVGSAVTTVQPGDHVVLSFSYDGVCSNCRSGHPGNCVNLNQLNFGGKAFDGTNRIHTTDGQAISTFFGQSSFATYSVVDEHGVTKVPEDVDLALLGPLGCGFQTGAGTVLNFIKPEFGQSLVVFGAGAVGLAAIMAAKIAGVEHIIAVNRHDNRLVLAKELGATAVINNQKEDAVARIKELVPGGVDYTIDTTGASPVILDAIHALRPSGKCVLLGIGGPLELNAMADIMAESKQLAGVIEGDAIPQLFIPKMVDYYRKGLFPFDKLVKFYDFKDIQQAFADSASGEVVKPIIRLSDVQA